MLKAPFPYFGGKRRIRDLVWPRFGRISNLIVPFFGSGGEFWGAEILWANPEQRIETINDENCYVANFWRATQHDPEAVVEYADGPVNEVDLHARHRWLVLSPAATNFRERMRIDPDFYDAKVAGWWCWGMCCWIGGGWCTYSNGPGRRPHLSQDEHGVVTKPPAEWEQRPDMSTDGRGLHAKLPDIGGHAGGTGRGVHQISGPRQSIPDLSGEAGAAGRGVHASAGHKKRPNIGDNVNGKGVHQSHKVPKLSGRSERDNGTGVHKKHSVDSDDKHRPQIGWRTLAGVQGRPQLVDQFARGSEVHSNDQASTCAERRAWLIDWFGQLRDRLRTVRVCCGDWLRVCSSRSVTTRLGVTGIFFDPPYPTHNADGSESRDGEIYATDRGRRELDRVRDRVLAYCRERGSNPLMRIAVCGYDSDGYAALEPLGWQVLAWKAQGGYGNRSSRGKENAARERVWFSPHCLDPENDRLPLFAGMAR